eukprot:6979760-Pyramimonas_sp.AAC.1
MPLMTLVPGGCDLGICRCVRALGNCRPMPCVSVCVPSSLRMAVGSTRPTPGVALGRLDPAASGH